MVNGDYSVKYNNNEFAGCGRVTLEDGIISGSDAGYIWIGTYQIEGTKLVGEVTATQDGTVTNVFMDADSIKLDIAGEIMNETINIVGIRKEYPGHMLQASLQPITY